MGRIIRSVVNTLLPVVLSAVGFIFAGPLGAALGAGVGAFLGGKIAPRQRVSGGGVSTRLTLDPKAAQVLVVGETIAPAQLIYWGTEGSDNKFLSMIVAHAAVPITAYGALKLDDVDVALSNGAATSPDRWRALLTVQRHLGAGASAFTSVAPAGKWTSAHAGRGLALQHFRMTYDGKRSQTGIPQNVAQVVKGSAVYDPRRDSTVGGSGTMRASDQTTWAYSAGGVDIGRNPALVELTYRIGWRENGRVKAGMGEDPANIDYASYIFAANICAQDVGGRPRYTIDGVLSLLDDHNTNLSRIHECAGSRPIDTGGLIGIWVAHDDTANVILDLTPDDFVDDLGWTPVPPVETRRNTATGTYADPTNSYQQRDYPPVEPAELLADDNGQALRDTLDFTMVTDVNQARALADLALRESRQGELTLTTNLRALGLRPADVVAVTHPRWNWDDKTFRIESWALQPQALRISMRLREIAAADYAPVQVVAVSTPAPPNTIGFLPPVIESFADLPGEVDYATQVGGAGKPALYATRNEDAGNLIPDPISLSEVYSSDPTFIYREVIQGGNPGRLADVYRVRAQASNGTYFGWTDLVTGLIAVSAADTIYFRVASYINADAVGNISMLFNLYGGNKNYVGGALLAEITLSSEIKDQWKTYSGSFVVPNNVSYIWPFIGQDSRTSGIVYFAEPYVGRVQPGATVGAPVGTPVGYLTAEDISNRVALAIDDTGLVQDGATLASRISGQLTDAKIAALNAAKLTGQIVATQIADDAITTPKLAAGAVTANELAVNAVLAANIAAGAITADKIAANSVDATKVATINLITLSAQIADAVITSAKVASLDAAKITTGLLDARRLLLDGATVEPDSSGVLRVRGGGVNTDQLATSAVLQPLTIFRSGSQTLVNNTFTLVSLGGSLASFTVSNIANYPGFLEIFIIAYLVQDGSDSDQIRVRCLSNGALLSATEAIDISGGSGRGNPVPALFFDTLPANTTRTYTFDIFSTDTTTLTGFQGTAKLFKRS